MENPVSVSIENITPALARSDRTIFCTPTDSATCDVVEAVMHPVDDRAVGEERRVAASHRVEQHRLAMNVEKGLLLTRETRLREILGRCAAAHGHVAVAPVLLLEPVIAFLNSLDEVSGQGCGQNRRPNPSAGGLQRIDVADVDIRKSVSNDLPEIGGYA